MLRCACIHKHDNGLLQDDREGGLLMDDFENRFKGILQLCEQCLPVHPSNMRQVGCLA